MKLLDVSNMEHEAIKLGIVPFSTPFGDLWSLTITPDNWRELKKEMMESGMLMTTHADSIEEIRNWETPQGYTVDGLPPAIVKPFEKALARVGSMVIHVQEWGKQ
jgi:hypothetical protein